MHLYSIRSYKIHIYIYQGVLKALHSILFFPPPSTPAPPETNYTNFVKKYLSMFLHVRTFQTFQFSSQKNILIADKGFAPPSP